MDQLLHIITVFAGDHCDEDVDGCAGDPCFTGIQCTDVPPSQLSQFPAGFICEPCPVGMDGNGQTCTGQSAVPTV